MRQLSFALRCLVLITFHLQAQLILGQGNPGQDVDNTYQPSLVVVIGILSFMFFLTFTLLLYAKFCNRRSSGRDDLQIHPGLSRSTSRFSGIDKKVIESLPFFRFSSLRGSREGLECAVCLSKFEDIEILRLLPKCRHAFHIHCIDQWLEKHSTCPLCRQKISSEDSAIFYSSSFRFLGNQTEFREDSDLELFVQREEGNLNLGSSRFSIGGSFRAIEMVNNKKEELLMQESGRERSDDLQQIYHKFNHRIIVSDFVFKNRWSNVSSSDLVFLNSEMLDASSSNRFPATEYEFGRVSTSKPTENEEIMKIKEEMERKRTFESKIDMINKNSSSDIPSTSSNTIENSIPASRYVSPGDKRSMSEITGISRYEDLSMKNKIRTISSIESNVTNEKMRQLWFPIARKTVQWFANRERRSQEAHRTAQAPDV